MPLPQYAIINEKEFPGDLTMEKSKFRENLKWWIIGSFISIVVGFTVILVMFFLEINDVHVLVYKKSTNDIMSYIATFFGAFIGAFGIKFIKRDFSWKYYSIVGVIYIIIFIFSINYICSFFSILSFSASISFRSIIKAINLSSFDFSHNPSGYGKYNFLVIAIFISFLGGFIIDIYRYIKRPKEVRV